MVAKYRFKQGNHTHPIFDDKGKLTGRKKLEPGDVVDLTDQQFINWADRFEPVDQSKDDDQNKGDKGTQIVTPIDQTRFTLTAGPGRAAVDTDGGDRDDNKVVISDDQLMNQDLSDLTDQDNQESDGDIETATTTDNSPSTTSTNTSDIDTSAMTVPAVKQIIANSTSREEVKAILAYERVNLQRAGVITAAESRLQQLDK